jgi:hypothetical protein
MITEEQRQAAIARIEENVMALEHMSPELRGDRGVDIRQAIKILNTANITIKSEDGKANMSFAPFPDVVFNDKNNDGKTYVSFNSLVNQGIERGDLRLLSYKKCMTLKKYLSRWLYKRISHHFTQAGKKNPYSIKVSTIIRDSGVKHAKKINDNKRKIITALEELKKNKIVQQYQEEVTYDENRKNKIHDVTFLIYLTDEICNDIKKGNVIQKTHVEIKSDEDTSEIIEELKKIKISQVVAKKIAKEYSEENIRSKLKYTKEQNPKNTASFFVAAIKNDYVTSEEPLGPKDQEAQETERLQVSHDLGKINQVFLRDALEKQIKSLDDATYNNWLASFKVLKCGADELTFIVDNEFIAQQLKHSILADSISIAESMMSVKWQYHKKKKAA